MLKKVISYTNYDGVKKTKTCYFHMSKAEVAEWEMSISGGLSEWLKAVIETQDAPTLMKLFKEIITRSYGIKSADGDRFEKSEVISTEFTQTGAYNELFIELFTKEGAMAEFVKAILPDDLNETAVTPVNN